ncbi:spermatogenesis-associated protein 4-like isoform X1 [Varanus komodoensis]|uniref:spermatogenesis-associated protein 4-like isoform X1 n=1 Tax=Varanus komodoensis TaxID=61221 RepID=UPI001CF7E9C7|nr:spermatogenesis-associated protein 4-like isoform X1 [Varanus komodoensis]XP_044282663.1 spermatogenesis-associated protein 4-like isoform X1 [Varanus komodoensis]
MHCFENGTSLAVKLSNWSQLGKFFAKRNLKPIRELIDGTIHCKPGAAEVFVQDIYTMLTNRRIKHSRDEEIDFTDRIYQEKLPMVARSTASRAIKTNIKLTELMVEPNIDKNRQKVNAIINMHMHRRLLDREQDPGEWLFQNIVWKTELQCAITKPLNLAFPPNIHCFMQQMLIVVLSPTNVYRYMCVCVVNTHNHLHCLFHSTRKLKFCATNREFCAVTPGIKIAYLEI